MLKLTVDGLELKAPADHNVILLVQCAFDDVREVT